MITILVYVAIAIIIFFLAFRIYVANKKNPNELMSYFFWGLLIGGIGQVLSLMVSVGYFLWQSDLFLYWCDLVGRLFLFLSAAFLIQMPLHLYFPNAKKRFYLSYLFVTYGVLLFLYGTSLSYRPYFDSVGIIHWQSPLGFNLAFGIPMFFAWLSLTLLFFVEFIRSRFKSLKSLTIGLGFLLATISGVAQDYGQTVLEYLFINLILVLGFILVFIGVFIKDKGK